MSIKEKISLGIIDSGPICVAYIFLGLSFGALSHLYGVSLIQTLSMCIFIYAIPLQIILIEMIKHGGANISEIILTSIIINFRFSLLSSTLISYFKKIKVWLVAITLPMLAASSFTVSHVKFESDKTLTPIERFCYYLGVSGTGFIISLAATVLGYNISGIQQSKIFESTLTMILPIHFMALTAMRWPNIRPILATFLGFLLMPIGITYVGNYALIAIPILVGILFTSFTHKTEKNVV